MELDAESSSEQPNNSPANPAVRNANYVTTSPLKAMKITDFNSCAALVFSTERIRRRSRNFREVLRNQYAAIQKLVSFYSGFSLATDSLVSQSYLLRNTATNTKFRFIFLHIGRIYVICHFFPFSTVWLNNIYTLIKSIH